MLDLGFTVDTEWLPVRVELAGGPGGWVDLHPLEFDVDGNGLLAGLDGRRYLYPSADFTRGVIRGHVVPCISARLQRRFHEAYPLRPHGRHDLQVLGGIAAES